MLRKCLELLGLIEVQKKQIELVSFSQCRTLDGVLLARVLIKKRKGTGSLL
jgi:hypothetical protein